MTWPANVGGWQGEQCPVQIYPYSSLVAVSTETVLMPMTELGVPFEVLRFVVDNPSANLVRVVVEHSEDGVREDVERIQLDVAPGSQGSVTIPEVLALHWQLSAMGNPDGGFPSSQVRWALLGRRR